MIKTRLVACIITKDQLVVQSFGFKKYPPIGNVKTAIEFFVNWDVDEIILIDIDASKEQRSPNIDLVEWACKECFVPLTVGGGIKTLGHIQQLLKAGSDKVCLNSIVAENMNFVTKASDRFGDQCITVSVDAVSTPHGYKLYDYINKTTSEIELKFYLKSIEAAGAGEILINSINRDGSKHGYDLDLLKLVSSAVNIPVIALGGVGRFEHLSQGITSGGCQAVAAANIFQHMEHSTIAAKAQMKAAGIDVRLSSDVKYENFSLDLLGRPF